MTYKFQRGAATLSGSITAEEGLDAGTAGVSDAGAIAGASTIAASGLASVGSIAVDDASTIGTDSDTDMLTLTNGSDITVASDIALKLSDGKLELNSTAVTSTAAELNLLDGAAAGTPANSKAVIYDGSSGVIANDFDLLSAGNVTLFDTVGANTLTLGAGTTTVEIAGDLTVQGTQTILNTTTLEIEDGNILIASGAAPGDNDGITIGTAGTPVTIQIGNSETEIQFSLPISASTYYGSGANLSNISADAASGYTLTGYNTDNYAASAIISTAANKGVHAWENASVTASYTFDLSGSYDAGNIVIIKGHDATATYPITIRPNDNTSNSIDGDTSIVLESDFASITMVYDGFGSWMII